MPLKISDFAKSQIRETAKYIHKEFGEVSKDRFMKSVRHTRKLIGINPFLGKKEVLAFWDVRREPNSLKRQINP